MIGEIRDAYLLQGGPAGRLGYPIASETDTDDCHGRISRFEHGEIAAGIDPAGLEVEMVVEQRLLQRQLGEPDIGRADIDLLDAEDVADLGLRQAVAGIFGKADREGHALDARQLAEVDAAAEIELMGVAEALAQAAHRVPRHLGGVFDLDLDAHILQLVAQAAPVSGHVLAGPPAVELIGPRRGRKQRHREEHRQRKDRAANHAIRHWIPRERSPCDRQCPRRSFDNAS